MTAIKRTSEDSRQQSRATKANKRRSQTIQVPTKLNDGGGQNEKSQLNKACNKKIRVSEIKKEEDPFLFFSIQSNVSIILLGDGGKTNRPYGEMVDAERVVVPSKVRKTKISCEAHPHLFFESLFSD